MEYIMEIAIHLIFSKKKKREKNTMFIFQRRDTEDNVYLSLRIKTLRTFKM